MTSQGTATADLPGQISAAVAIPPVPRVLYAKNPLVEVICQLRFPAVLKIDAATPAGFQERIRDSFPLLNEEEQVFPLELPPEVLQLFKTTKSPQITRRTWKFISEDTKWSISLTREFASLETTEYTRWEEFRERLMLMCHALQEEYHPSFLTRIGLRYRDLILRSQLELTAASWSELLRPHLAAEYSERPFADAIRGAAHVVHAEFIEEKLKLGLRHGTAQRENSDEIGYLIDSDFYTDERTEVDNALERLDFFNKMAGRLFRWCITNRLHDAMEPRFI